MTLATLNSVADIIMGQSPPSSTYNKEGIGLPFFQGKADFSDMFATVRVYCAKPNKIAEAGDILISVRAPVGPTNISPERSCIGRGLAALRVKEGLDQRYLLYFLRWHEPRWEEATKGSTFDAITKSDLLDVQVPVPPLTEQKRIAAILDKADSLRRLFRYALELSDTFLQSTFLQMFGDPATNLMGWSEYCVADISTKVTDGEHATPERTEAGVKLLSARNVKNGYLDYEAGLDFIPEKEYQRIRKRCDPRRGDVLMSCSGTIGRVASVDTDERLSMVRSVALIKPKHDMIKSKYLEHYLRTPYTQQLIQRSVNQSSQANIFLGPIKKLPILLPPIIKQKSFVDAVQQFEQIQAQQREASRQANHLFDTLLHRAFRGEL